MIKCIHCGHELEISFEHEKNNDYIIEYCPICGYRDKIHEEKSWSRV